MGGGFGGVRTALDLEKKLKKDIQRGETEIAVIDRKSYHLFASALYEVASAANVKRDSFSTTLRKTVCLPYSDIFEGKAIKFVQAEISEVNLKDKFVKTQGDEQFNFDYLVIALGSQSSDFGISGVKEYAYKFKTLEDALMLNDRIESMMKDMANGKRKDAVNILIGGAGLTGIEVASELAGSAQSIAKRCGLKGKCSSVVLFEAGPKILPMATDKERKIIMNRLTKHGIMVMENSIIEEVGNDFVKLKNGQRINGDLVIWTAGVRPNDFIGSINGLPLTNGGRVSVENTLSVKGLDKVFGLGDNIEFIDPDTQKPIPAMAQIAIKEAGVVAKNIVRSVKGKSLSAYKPAYNLWVVTVGGKFALANLNGTTVSGFGGWIVRGLANLRYMLGVLPFFKALSIFWEEVTIFTKND